MKWFLPFVSFIFGYFFTQSFFHTKHIIAPDLIGKSLQSALRETSQLGLNVRLLREQVDADIPEGTVLEQFPKPRRSIKPKQYLFLTLASKPASVLAPDLLESNQSHVADQCKQAGIPIRFFWLQSNYPKMKCMAQVPMPGHVLSKHGVVSYISQGNSRLIVFPRLKGRLLNEVKSFLDDEGIVAEVVHNGWLGRNHVCDKCKVIDQRPMAGAIIDKSRKVYVQLQVCAD